MLLNGVGHIYLGQRLLGVMILVGSVVWISFVFLYLKADNPIAYLGWAIWFVQLVYLVMLVQKLKKNDEAPKSSLSE